MEEEILDQNVVEEAHTSEELSETTQVDPATNQQEEEQKQPSKQELNFIEVRKRAAQAERERDELRKYVEEMKRSEQEKPKEAESQPAYDDLVEYRVVAKQNAKIEKLEQRLEQDRSRTYQATVEAQLRSKYSDFDSILNKDNLLALRELKPAMAQSIAANQDVYSQAEAAYDAIKTFGIGRNDAYDDDHKNAQQNAAKPRPSASIGTQVGETPLSKANSFSKGFNKDEKDRLYREMLESTGRI